MTAEHLAKVKKTKAPKLVSASNSSLVSNPQSHEKYKEARKYQTLEEAKTQLAEWAEERKNKPDEKTFNRCFTAYDTRQIALALKEFQQHRDDDNAFDFDIFYDAIKEQLLGRFLNKDNHEEDHGITKTKVYNKCATLVARANAKFDGLRNARRAQLLEKEYSTAEQNKIIDKEYPASMDWRTPIQNEAKHKRFTEDEFDEILGLAD